MKKKNKKKRGLFFLLTSQTQAIYSDGNFKKMKILNMQLSVPVSTRCPGQQFVRTRVAVPGVRYAGRSFQAVKAWDKTVTKSQIVTSVAEKTKSSQKTVNDILTLALNDVIKEVSNGKKVVFTGFGSFEPRKRSARKGFNPKTMEPINIPETVAVGFKVGKTFKEKVKNAKTYKK
eukprot:TRINITY_DN94471_c0_g1_i1.p2 TRINITY_DN94471_c0_g1~~TRINITY_DN94471_c0_g1_i1.p2  ORF type:complete len:175 (+),score=11.86 TRINITY_DN94471_c0_g1_i1:263-787(+)